MQELFRNEHIYERARTTLMGDPIKRNSQISKRGKDRFIDKKNNNQRLAKHAKLYDV